MAGLKIIGLICALGLSLATSSLQAGERESHFFARAPIHDWSGQHFTIIQIKFFNEFDGFRSMLETTMSAYPDQIQAMQAAIRANTSLAAALRARGVQINNVGAIQQGFNGNIIFYQR